MKLINRIASIFILGACAFAGVTACNDGKSYAELLTDESHSINRFLADQVVINSIPEDTIFEVGEKAPYYRLDDEGNFYMQVLNAGTDEPGNRAVKDQEIYFRTTRYNLHYYKDGELIPGDGNAIDVAAGNYFFRFENFQIQSSSQWGSGLQQPLYYLPIDCEVNLVVKSQFGMSNEVANVIPYLYNIRYYKRLS